MDSEKKIPDHILDSNLSYAEAYRNIAKFKEKAKRKTKLGSSHQLTLRMIVKFFLVEWNKKSHHDRRNGCYISTKNTSLARICDCTEKSIRNHIKRLIEADILTKKIGNGKGVKIWINPKALFDFSDSDRKNVPGLVPWNSVENQRTILSEVDNLKNLSKNMEGQLNTRSNLYNVSIDLGSCSEVARKFWSHAKKSLYPNLNISPKRDQVLSDLIETGIKDQFNEGEIAEQIYWKLTKRLNAVVHWFKAHKEVIPPDPYHYFVSNMSGFRFWNFESKQKEKLALLERINNRRRIRIACLSIAENKSKSSKYSILQKQISMIKKTNDTILKNWFLHNVNKLYTQ